MERSSKFSSDTNIGLPNVKEAKQMMSKGISLELYIQRIRHGWDSHKAMNTKPKNQDSINNYKQFSDFELEYLLNHSITYSDYKNRRRLGWSREEAIFIPKGIKRYQILNHDLYPVTREELIIIYKNETTIDTYRTRRAMGWGKEEAMNTPKKQEI
ncbi:TPA: hypothetical protein PB422_002502 [Staphylococcus aureus]|uniref:hypothetical protein n=2 Tax=Staphylococcus TaxID=1279 RepID=UPI002287BFA8|nr:hypothetical protein [Staphylococcus epidermidis]HCU7578097.1 hypothetical protein [Staphylococcus aureus]MCG1566837.1 hypothetical protein [Staphylococcus epidermidis]HCW0036287.1 hypothetical protein [Staphylococcus aureus]HCW0039068.1 hypothetical protein [Staphylococcus aureus]HCX0627727.1 hypothetical protein [Staphylococcus aureus]